MSGCQTNLTGNVCNIEQSQPLIGAGPEIYDVSLIPEYPTPLDLLNISANVTDPDGIQAVFISYCNATNCFFPKDMIKSSGNRYFVQMDLAMFLPGDILHINVNADDALGNSNMTENYSVTIRSVPNSLTVTAIFNRGIYSPGEDLIINGSAILDNGAPAALAHILLKIEGVVTTWESNATSNGSYEVHAVAPSTEGTYNITINATLGNKTGHLTRALRVSAEPKAPDFDFTDIDGKPFRLANYSGKVLVLDFMSIPCPSCKKIEAALLSLYPEYKDRDVEFISVDILPSDTDSDLRTYRDTKGINWRITRAPPGLMEKYGISEIPVIAIVNGNGYITFMEKGILSSDDAVRKSIIADEIERALEGGKPIQPPVQVGFLLLAISMGVAAFFSPCSFPMLPGYVSYYLGLKKSVDKPENGENTKNVASKPTGKDDTKEKKARRRASLKFAIKGGAASAFGLLVVFIIVGALIIPLGSVIVGYIKHMDLVVGIVLLILGALMLTNLQYYRIINPIKSGLDRAKTRLRGGKGNTKKSEQSDAVTGGVSLFGYGVGYGAASLGCTLPVFIAILIAGMGAGLFNGLLVLFAFGLSAAVLMIAITLLVAAFEMALLQKLKAATPYIKKASGIILIIVAFYMLYYYWTVARFI